MLVDYAADNKCKTINLVNQTEKECDAKKNPYILRNWGYYGLRKSIEYKAGQLGIKLILVDRPTV